MNDDVGMTIGSGGAKIPSKSWGKCLSAAFALAAFCAHAEVEMIGSIEWRYSVEDGKAVVVSAQA